MKIIGKLGLGAVTLLGLNAGPALAQDQLNLYCPMQVDWCQAMAVAYEKKTGTKVTVTQKSTGEIFAQIRAEKDNPRGDIWWGGTADPHLAAAEEKLTQPYTSPALASLNPWARAQHTASGGRSVGIAALAIGFGYNPELLGKKNLAAPACWADLLKPAYKGEIQMANPNSSGTAYAVIATLVQMMGEDKAFDYLKGLHANINTYTRSGVAPAKAVARGETGVSISFLQDVAAEAKAGFPAKMVVPCEGTALGVDAMSIIAGSRNLEGAKRFYDWALSPEAQAIGATVNQLHTPSNPATPTPPGGPSLAGAKLIDYNFARFGASAERKRLLGKWDTEVGALPR